MKETRNKRKTEGERRIKTWYGNTEFLCLSEIAKPRSKKRLTDTHCHREMDLQSNAGTRDTGKAIRWRKGCGQKPRGRSERKGGRDG